MLSLFDKNVKRIHDNVALSGSSKTYTTLEINEINKSVQFLT